MRRRTVWIACVLTALALGLACDRQPATTVDADAALEPGTRDWTTADGERLRYTVAGIATAPETVVLVHCWMCDSSFWDAQLPVLAKRFRTVTLDLPGHGASSAGRETWSVLGYGEDVAGLVEELGLDDVVLVGHSMGGPVVLHAAALLQGKVRGIVAVDTLHDVEFDYNSDEINAAFALFEQDFAGTCNGMVQQMFPEADVDEVLAHVRKVGCNPARAGVGVALIRDFQRLDLPALMRDAGVPIRAVNADQPNPTRTATNRKFADFDVALMEGVGHYPHMTRPDEFNPLLLRAIDDVLEP